MKKRRKREFKLCKDNETDCCSQYSESGQYHDPIMVLKEAGRRSTGRKSASDSEMQSVCVEIL